MSDIPEKAVEAALQAVTESGLNAWVTTEGMRAALAAALPHLASAQPQPSESEAATKAFINVPREEVIASLRAQLREKIAALAKARAAATAECEAIARKEYDNTRLPCRLVADRIADAIDRKSVV